MYEELIERLRDDNAWKNCDFDFIYGWMHQAADAIEELWKKYLASEVDNTNLTGWLAEEHAKHLWILVTERLPLRGDAVLCVGDNGIGIADFVCGDKWCALPWFYVDGEQETNVTHWMPLPQPPKEET